jgi:hypothetical protein
MQTDIHALSEIRIHDPSVRAGEDGSCLRPRGHCDRHIGQIPAKNELSQTHFTVYIKYQISLKSEIDSVVSELKHEDELTDTTYSLRVQSVYL